MNRLEVFLNNYPTEKYDEVDYPEDIVRIRAAVPELEQLCDEAIATLWGDYSSAEYAASWMNEMGDYKRFREWLLSEPWTGLEMYPPEWYPPRPNL